MAIVTIGSMKVTRMRTAMPNEELMLTLLGSVAMEHRAFDRLLPQHNLRQDSVS